MKQGQCQNVHHLHPNTPCSRVCGKAFSVQWFTLWHKYLPPEDSSHMSISLLRGVPRGVTTLQTHSRNRRTKNILLKINIVPFQRYWDKVSNNMKLSSIFPILRVGTRGYLAAIWLPSKALRKSLYLETSLQQCANYYSAKATGKKISSFHH